MLSDFLVHDQSRIIYRSELLSMSNPDQDQQNEHNQQYHTHQSGSNQNYQQYYQNYQQQFQQGDYQNYQAYQQGYIPQHSGQIDYTTYGNYGNYNQNSQYNQQSYQGYQNSNQRKEYQAYNSQSKQSYGMTLQDFQSQQPPVSTVKPKRTLKLASNSGIKLVGAKKAVENLSSEKSNSTPLVENKESDSTVKKEILTKVENLKISEVSVQSSSKKDGSGLNTTPAADALIKEQEVAIDEEVVKDMFGGKDHISIIFMGHVDAGKSTMGGNILYLTGSVDKRTVEKYEREAKDAGRQGWYLSWVMDTNKEERNDGKTIEVGRAYFETEKRRYTILDAPGHKMYVSEMIGGASQADVGILVISARKGEYETGFERGGQTREHALLAKTQGVNKMIVVVNKMDDPTVNWDKGRYDQCVNNVSNFLKAVGYNVKQDVVFMPVSGFTGAGLKDRVDSQYCPWYEGPSLLEYLDSMKHLDRHINAPFMLPIASKMKDMGTIVEGKIESGHIKKGNHTLLMPNRTSVEILTIYNETEAEVDMAVCGEQVRLRLKGIDEEDISAGFVLTSPKNPVKNVTRFIAQIAIVELKSIMSAGFSCVMHIHTAIEEVVITRLLHKLEKGTNRKSKKPPAFAKKGMKIIAVVETNEPVCVETYEDYPQLGRFTLRDQGITIAIGKIVKILD